MQEEPLTIRIKDLNLAAALISCGFPMIKNYRDKYNREYFVFDHTEELEHAMRDFRADTLHVRARQYSDNQKMLKSVIYADN